MRSGLTQLSGQDPDWTSAWLSSKGGSSQRWSPVGSLSEKHRGKCQSPPFRPVKKLMTLQMLTRALSLDRWTMMQNMMLCFAMGIYQVAISTWFWGLAGINMSARCWSVPEFSGSRTWLEKKLDGARSATGTRVWTFTLNNLLRHVWCCH